MLDKSRGHLGSNILVSTTNTYIPLASTVIQEIPPGVRAQMATGSNEQNMKASFDAGQLALDNDLGISYCLLAILSCRFIGKR